MPPKTRSFTLAVLACASTILGACAATSTTDPAAASSSLATSFNTMNQTPSSAKHVVAQLVAALKSERMLRPDFFKEASLQQWFGPHLRTSAPSPLKHGVQREALMFGTTRLNLTHMQAGGGLSFSLQGPSPWGLTTLTVQDLTSLLGSPQETVDIVAEQMRGSPSYPKPEAGQPVISPQPIRHRGATTHPQGNNDLSWHWKMGGSAVDFTAKINGDGTVSTIFGSQETP